MLLTIISLIYLIMFVFLCNKHSSIIYFKKLCFIFSGISYGASVCVTGDIVETKKHRGGIEMQCSEIELIGSCTEAGISF